jgi:hypothetical protein
LDSDIARMQMHQIFDDRQAKSGAVMTMLTRRAGLEEGLPQTW